LSPSELPYFQTLLNRLGLAAGAGAPQTIGFTSCARKAGVSTVAIGLAELAARSGQQVLLVDACCDGAGLARRLGISPTPGLWDLLASEVSLELSMAATDVDNLFLLPGGRRPNESLLLGSRAALTEQLTRWKQRFDLVVLDLPPALPQEPLVVWSGALDGVVLVIKSEKTEAEEAWRVKRTLLDCEARLLGAVLTQQRSYLPGWMSRTS
jgi:Mrp family chromosome partitioning ATPase